MPRQPVAPIYLPLTASAAAAFFDEGRLPDSAIERAALFAAIAQLSSPLAEAALQAMLLQAQSLFQADPARGAAALQDARAGLDGLDAAGVRRQLARSAVTWAPEEAMQRQAWRGTDGRYDFAFQQYCRQMLQPFDITLAAAHGDAGADPLQTRRRPPRRLPGQGTRDQQVAASVIAAGDGEHIAVQAYAGTGKTHLVHRLTSALGPGFTYIAPSEGHLFGFRQATAGTGSAVRALHLWALAHELSRLHARALGLAHAPQRVRATYSAAEQARHLGIGAIGPFSPAQVVAMAGRILKTWCHTDSPLPGLRDVLRVLPGAGPDAPALLAASLQLWEQMFVRHRLAGHLLDVDIVHIAKWLMVSGARIPASYGTLLIDEAHDLQPAWQHLFARYEGGCVLLGDPNQRLRGQVRLGLRGKQVWMGQSVRIGNGIEQLVGTTLALAGNDPLAAEFTASRAHITARRPYERFEQAPASGLHVYGDPHALLERILADGSGAAAVALLPASARQLRQLAIELVDSARQQRQGRSRQWQARAQHLRDNGRQQLVAAIDAGLDLAAVDALLARLADTTGASLLLGLVEHAKNLEADEVSLAPCCFDGSTAARQLHPARAVYQAMTRARHALWLPGEGMARLGDQLRAPTR